MDGEEWIWQGGYGTSGNEVESTGYFPLHNDAGEMEFGGLFAVDTTN